MVDTGFTAEVAVKRKREFIRTPKAGLALLGVKAEEVREVVITHMHYDHVGTFFDFPASHVPPPGRRDELRYRPLHAPLALRPLDRGRGRGRHGARAVQRPRRLPQGRGGDRPGVSLHHIGGHTPGLQSVRVHTQRGWVVLASDATHYYEHFETGRCFPSIVDLGGVLEGYDTLRKLADSPQHIVPDTIRWSWLAIRRFRRSSKASRSGLTSCRPSDLKLTQKPRQECRLNTETDRIDRIYRMFCARNPVYLFILSGFRF